MAEAAIAAIAANRIAHLRFVDTLRPGSSTLFAPDVTPLNHEELGLWRLGRRALMSTDPLQHMR